MFVPMDEVLLLGMRIRQISNPDTHSAKNRVLQISAEIYANYYVPSPKRTRYHMYYSAKGVIHASSLFLAVFT